MKADRVRDDLLMLAAELAGFCDMAIAGEGNVSGALGEERFCVKGSGTSMAALESRHLVEVDARSLLTALEERADLRDDEIETLLLGARVSPDALKPSVESLFHAWLLAIEGVEFVGHAHPIAANALLCSPHAERYAARRLFPDQVVYCGPESVLVPYVDPGLKLARIISEAVESYRGRSGMVPKIILVKNHGVIALGRTASDVAAALKMAEKSARVFIDAAALGGPVFMSADEVARIDGRVDEHYRQRMLQTPS